MKNKKYTKKISLLYKLGAYLLKDFRVTAVGDRRITASGDQRIIAGSS